MQRLCWRQNRAGIYFTVENPPAQPEKQMPFKFKIRSKSKVYIFSGFFGLVVLILIFILPTLFAPSLSPDEAEKWIRQYLKKEQTSLHMERLKTKGKSLPDRQEAEQLKADLIKLEAVPFKSIEIKSFLFAPPGSSTRIFIAKVVLDDGSSNVPRYFSLSAENNFFNFFWVNEHSGWMWYFST